MWRKGLIAVASILAVLLVIILVNTLRFGVDSPSYAPVSPISLDSQAVERLTMAVRLPTISSEPDAEKRHAQFEAFQQLLIEEFPSLHRTLRLERINEHGLLYTWFGSDLTLKPILLLAHQDVVPIEPGTESDWEQPPFSGNIADGYVWGRGSWDDKSTLMASLEAVEMLLTEGKTPERTVVLAFGHDEEVGGELGAGATASYLAEQGVDFEFVLDEGAPITQGLMADIQQPVAMVGIAEKGYLTLELQVRGSGGHSSVPSSVTAIGQLARAIHRLETHPFPARLNEPVREMFATLGPHMPWWKRMMLANQWLFESLLVNQMETKRTSNAYVRTTIAPTMFNAGVKENVLPQTAQAIVNFRIVPGQSSAEVIEQVKGIIKNEQVLVREVGAISSEPSVVSGTDSYGYHLLEKSILQVNPDVLVSPALLFGATDSRHYAALTDQTFRFTPIRIGPDDIKRIHGTNERIAVVYYENTIRFYYQLLINAAISPDHK